MSVNAKKYGRAIRKPPLPMESMEFVYTFYLANFALTYG
jgi:hypothetical protein